MKKIIAVIFAVCVMCCFAVTVSATDINGGVTSGGGGSSGRRTDYGNVLEVYIESIGEYINGEITIDELLEKSGQIISESENDFADRLGIGLIQDLSTAIENGVINAGYSVKDWLSGALSPYATTESKSTTDLQGYGALAIFYPYSTDNDMVFYYYTSTYGTYSVDNNGKYTIYGDGAGKRDYYYKDVLKDTTSYTGSYSTSGYKATFYGDWRNPDNIEESLSTDDEFVDIPTYDFSGVSDIDLEELLQELYEILERQIPDLSTMEGLLESIYFRLGELDKDDDNALLSDINLAILALSNSNDENAAAVIASLAEIRDEIKNMSGDINDNLDDLVNNFDKIIDFDIPDELLNVDFDNLSDELKDKIDDIVELVTTLVAKGVPMAAINGGLLFYQDIIFNSHEPQDIVFDLTFNGEQYNFTILSTSFFGSEGAQALQIIKNFVAIVLGYAWVLAMRKKAASMMN